MARKWLVFFAALCSFLRIPLLRIPLWRRQIYSILLAISLLCSLMPRVSAIAPADLVQQGQNHYEQGRFGAALTNWQQAEAAYRQIKDPVGIVGSQSNQSQALIALGLYRRACKTLATAAQTTENICTAAVPEQFGIRQTNLPLALQVQVLNNLGEVLRLVGNLAASQVTLAQAWEVAKPLNVRAKSEILLSIANNLRDLGNRDRDRTNKLQSPSFSGMVCPTQPVSALPAHRYYQQAIACYQAAGGLTAQLNLLNLQVETAHWLKQHDQTSKINNWQFQQAELIAKIKPQLLSPAQTYSGLNQQINFVRSLVGIAQWSLAEQLLQSAIATAKTIDSPTALVNAIGTLGWLNEQAGRWTAALGLTQQALALVGADDDHLYQWEWQLARILRQQPQPDSTKSQAAYERAVIALEKTRRNLRVINADAQFALRDSVEPLYRELVDLSLQSRQPNLPQVIAQIDALQLAELENFLQCQLTIARTGVRSVNEFAEDSGAVVFYPIILADRLELILRLPGNKFQRVVVPVKQAMLEDTIERFRQNLSQPQFGWDEAPAGQLYDWLIRPAQKYLGADTKNLVFVMDGMLQNMPVAALYDRQLQEYAIDQYPLAVTPGLKILGAKQSGKKRSNILIGGLTTKSIPVIGGKRLVGYEALQYAETEVQGVKRLFPRSTELVGANFTVANIRRSLSEQVYGIIHLATHGTFSSDPRQTFIVTDGGGIINLDSLQEMLRQSGETELIVLSACETATGDRRATLGLAGVALKSGAASTLASLWSVDDGATADLMQGFYRSWNSGRSKAAALQAAQQSVRRDYPHPYYWAAFMLVGNWL
jgi:CHAT domain-containing protein